MQHKFGIPTVHKGRRFRSRLEARWASFFDLMGWPYEYEPFELKGWIPDFLLTGNEPVLVEVKPVHVFPAHIANEIGNSGAEQEVLILGCTFPVRPREDDQNRERCFGWLAQVEQYQPDEPWAFHWGDAMLGKWEAGKGAIGFCHSWCAYSDRISGGYDGGSFGGLEFSIFEALNHWTNAGNLSQWRPGR
jgi:hypothetical protein